MTRNQAENAVRMYLLYLDDPTKVVDREAVSQLEAEVSAAADPIDKLRLLTKLRQVSEGNGEQLRQGFCAHAKQWAETNEVDPASFVELGVDAATMRAAGFTSIANSTSGTVARPRRPKERNRRVRVEEVQAIVAKRTGEFTLAELVASSGGSQMTVRRAVTALVDSGDVERLGPAPNWPHEGRAPIIYRCAKP